MRRTITLAVSLLGFHLLAGYASAQCCGYIAPPRAPDFYNTKGQYLKNNYGVTYGPIHNVYPNFPPFQGMLPGPCPPGCSPAMFGPPNCGPNGCQPGYLYPGSLFAGVNHAGMAPPGGWPSAPYPTWGGMAFGPWGNAGQGGFPGANPYAGMIGGYPYMNPAMMNPGAGNQGFLANATDSARNAAMRAAGAPTPQQQQPYCPPGYAMGPMGMMPGMGYMAVPGQWAAVPNPYAHMGQQGGENGFNGNQGTVAFPTHLYARSPRDFFMVDTDPRSSPYTYGNLSGLDVNTSLRP